MTKYINKKCHSTVLCGWCWCWVRVPESIRRSWTWCVCLYPQYWTRDRPVSGACWPAHSHPVDFRPVRNPVSEIWWDLRKDIEGWPLDLPMLPRYVCVHTNTHPPTSKSQVLALRLALALTTHDRKAVSLFSFTLSAFKADITMFALLAKIIEATTTQMFV